MNPLTQFKKISILPLIAVALVIQVVPTAAQADEVTHWNQIAMDILAAFPPAAGGAPNALQINMGMTQGAVYDAVNAIERRYQPYLLATHFNANASKEAAAATAAYRVLSNIVSTVPATIPFPNRASLQASLDAAYAASLDAIPNGPPKTEGINAGNAAADAMITARQNDGRFGPSPWVPNYEPGHWQPLLNPDGTLQLDPTAWVANVRPFLMQSPSQFRTDGPNALTSTAYAEDFNEVKALGRIDSMTRTAQQTHIAIFWQGAPPPLAWNSVARNLANRYALDIGDSALLFAMQNLSAADALINGWNDKYYWDFWRPWTAIQRADEDGNPDTEPDPSWTALLTAPYPEHPSGHLCGDGAHLEVLRIFFGTDRIAFDVTSSRFPNDPPRHYDRFSDALSEIIDARIWAGLHFRTSDIQAKILGRKVVHYMEKHYFQPLQ
jgi:hypothetical protein